MAQNARIWGIWARNFQQQMTDISLRSESQYFLAQNAQIWAFGLETWKTKAGRKFQISPILKF